MIERNWDRPLNLELVEEPNRYKPDQLELADAPLMYAHFGGVQDMAEHQRLKGQLYRVKRLMSDGRWRTLEEISRLCGCTEAAASARLRDLRKSGFGENTVKRNPSMDKPHINVYKLILNPEDEDAIRWAKTAEEEARRYLYAKHPKPFDIAI